MTAKKERLRDKLIEIQRGAIELSARLEAHKRETLDKENDLFLELVGVLDAFENVLNNLNLDSLDKSNKRAFKSVGAIERKLRRLLEARGIERLEFPDGRAQPGRCKVIETQTTDEMQEGAILAVVRNGYRRSEHILRPAEVITASRSRTASEPQHDG